MLGWMILGVRHIRTRRVRHDRLYLASGNDLDGEASSPMRPDTDYRINEAECDG